MKSLGNQKLNFSLGNKYLRQCRGDVTSRRCTSKDTSDFKSCAKLSKCFPVTGKRGVNCLKRKCLRKLITLYSNKRCRPVVVCMGKKFNGRGRKELSYELGINYLEDCRNHFQ